MITMKTGTAITLASMIGGVMLMGFNTMNGINVTLAKLDLTLQSVTSSQGGFREEQQRLARELAVLKEKCASHSHKE